MTCFCSDILCKSCGPAQGNHFCPFCGYWDSENPFDSDVDIFDFARTVDTGCYCTLQQLNEYCKAEQADDRHWEEIMANRDDGYDELVYGV